MLGMIFKGNAERKQADAELRDLLAEVHDEREAVREERAALSEERAALRAQAEQTALVSRRLSRLDQSADDLAAKSEAATRRLEKLNAAVETFEQRLRCVDELGVKLNDVSRQVGEAVRSTKALTEPDGPLQHNRKSLEDLEAQVRDVQATLGKVRQESTELNQAQAELRLSGVEAQRSLNAFVATKRDFADLQQIGSDLRRDVQGAQKTADEARAASANVMDSLGEMSRRLDSVLQLQDLSKEVERRVTSLHMLADHVTQRTKSLESQRHTIDHAVAETARLNQLVWTMDAQIAKLNEGRDRMHEAEEAVSRIEQIARTATQDLTTATEARDQFAKESARLESDARTQLARLRETVEQIGLYKDGLGAMDDRLRSLSDAMGDMETRAQALLAKDDALAAALQKAESLDKMFSDLRIETEELARKQNSLDGLADQLGTMEAMSRRAAAQQQSLMKAQEDLASMQAKLDEVHQAHAEVARVRLQLTQERASFEEFEQRTAAMIGRTPEIEARLDGLLEKFARLDEGTEAARKLGETSNSLDAEVNRVAARMEFVERLEERVNSLFVMSRDVEQMLGQQAARGAQIQGLTQQCESLAARLGSTQQHLESLSALQARLAPLAGEVSRIDDALHEAQRKMAEMKKDDTSALEQRTRLVGLIEQSIAQAAETTDRLRHVQALGDELAQVASRGDEAISQLAQVQARQREVLAQATLTEAQLQRADDLSRQLDQRRGLLTQAEKSLKDFEIRLADLDRHAGNVQRAMTNLAEREAMVQAVKAEVEAVRQISSSSKADLQFVAEQRGEVAELRAKVDTLLERLHGTDEKLELVDAWRKKIDEVKVGAEATTALVAGLQNTLEHLSEQRVLVDDVSEKLARLDLTVEEAHSALSRLDDTAQEAQATLRTLQREREVAERVEKSIKQLRRPTGAVV